MEKAIVELVAFVEKGGDVDAVLTIPEKNSDSGDGPDELRQLREQFQDIKEIQQRLPQLENLTDSKEDGATDNS